jgi:hypothetical protein
VEITFNTDGKAVLVGARVNVKINFMCVALAMVGCSSTPAASNACALDYSGNLDTQVSATGCASWGAADAGDPLLVIDTTSELTGRLQVMIDLGATPIPAAVSSDVVSNWNAVVFGFGDAGCAFTGGSTSVPFGSFDLALDSASAGATPHGSITLVLYVHAPPGNSCGPSDVENVHVAF